MYYSVVTMRVVSLKTMPHFLFFALAVIALSRCVVEPINLQLLVEDEKVVEVIVQGSGIVDVVDSDPSLIPGGGRITGLVPGKYYMVEEWDEDGTALGIQFVTGNGRRSVNFTDIGRVSGRIITGLTNFRHYRVTPAVPLAWPVTCYDLASPSFTGGGRPVNIIDGEITLPLPRNGYYLNLSINSTNDYAIAKVPVTPDGSTSAVTPVSGSIIALEGEETVTDYVFIEIDEQGDIIQGSFSVLRVNISDSAAAATLNVNISPAAITDGNSPQTDNPSITYSQNDERVIISVNDADQYDDYDADGIIWYINGTQKGTGESFTLVISDAIEYKIVGVYTITVEAAINGIPYSTVIDVTVTP